jgi:transcriptional regulator with PAS, ATPase and Fis domain
LKKSAEKKMRIIRVGGIYDIDGFIDEYLKPFNNSIKVEFCSLLNVKQAVEAGDTIIADVPCDYENDKTFNKIFEIKKEVANIILIFLIPEKSGADMVLELIGSGADECIAMPCEYAVFEGAMKKHFNSEVEDRLLDGGDNFGIVGVSPQIKLIKKFIRKVAASRIAVLIEGESGTGKELVAHAVHKVSERSDQPFIPVNCGAIPKDLLENEFFGHEAGSYTGATVMKKGLFEIADNGTLFIDEIGEMEPGAQIKLLRVLENGTFMRLGGTKEIKVNVRIVAATNKIIREEMNAGRFRRDLYYRLSGIMIKLPPLRNRRADIPILAEHFLKTSKTLSDGSIVKKINPDTMEVLCRYEWPGNVRELLNVMERSIFISEKSPVISVTDLPRYVMEKNSVNGESSEKTVIMHSEIGSLEEFTDNAEKDFIKSVLDRFGDDKIKAADVLKISIANLYRKLKKYGIS